MNPAEKSALNRAFFKLITLKINFFDSLLSCTLQKNSSNFMIFCAQIRRFPRFFDKMPQRLRKIRYVP